MTKDEIAKAAIALYNLRTVFDALKIKPKWKNMSFKQFVTMVKQGNFSEIILKLSDKNSDIEKIISHKGFPMRIRQFRAIKTKGKSGLKSGLDSPLYKQLYNIFKDFNQREFATLVNSILKVKSKVN